MATRTASQYIRLKIEQVTGSQYEMTFCYFFYIVKMKVDRIMSQSFRFFLSHGLGLDSRVPAPQYLLI